MFDNIDELFIDDYSSGNEGYAGEATYFDAENMYMDSALESFSEIDVEESSDTEYFYAVESVLNAMETDLWAISMEADEAKKKFGAGINEAAQKGFQHIKNGIAKIFNGLYDLCENHAAKLIKKGKIEAGAKWRKKADWCKRQAERLKGNLTKEQIMEMEAQAKKTQKACEEAIRNDRYKFGNPLITQGSLPGNKQQVATVSGETVKRANNKAANTKTSSLPLNQQYPDDPGKRALNNPNGERDVRATPPTQAGPSLNSFIVEDLDEGYSVAVEGLFSKPKTAEKLLVTMQKKVGRLKSIGACDDMLRQLNTEASKFNSAISALKKASGEYSQTNDKKALKAAAGPVLKDLNKTCKLLKIKSIASDPKNISQEEIAKLHDFIKGAKQLIVARKKVLSGAATESVLTGYEDDFEIASEGYDDVDNDMIDFLGGDDFYDEVEIAGEALIEDFVDADKDIAVATEGIIDPDVKRAARVKFGEKKRQIQSVVKKARQAKKAKDFTTAISLYQEAKKGYQGLLTEAKKIPDRATGNGKASSLSKKNLINWCIKKMGECDNAIEAIRNGQMKSERKAAKKAAKAEASESYLDNVSEYEAVIESLGEDDYDDDTNPFDDFDMDGFDDEFEGDTLESLMM